MPLSRDQVADIAHLARLALDADEAGRYAGELSRILDLVAEMEQVDTEAVTPLAHPLEALQRLRPDRVTEGDQREACQAVAPRVEAGLYLVPRVIE
jgi:aspartyl-tRNA(Asn)/glutamyl-tRNA(Gln) amidotransferase subunit C